LSKKHEHHHHDKPASETHGAAGHSQQSTNPEQFPLEQESVEALQKKLAESEAALAEANDKMMRFKAEAENTRRRSMLDVENANKYGIEKLARELLNVVDSLEHGLEAVSEPDQTQIVHLREGMQLTHKLLLDTLDKFQIKQVNPKGESFDPKQHEALTAQPSADMEPNKVLLVVQKGYLIHDRILRPARVIVSKAP
jgi:molecular chaperone GrpE